MINHNYSIIPISVLLLLAVSILFALRFGYVANFKVLKDEVLKHGLLQLKLRLIATYRTLTQRNFILIDAIIEPKHNKDTRKARLLRRTDFDNESDFLTLKLAIMANFEVEKTESKHQKELYEASIASLYNAEEVRTIIDKVLKDIRHDFETSTTIRLIKSINPDNYLHKN